MTLVELLVAVTIGLVVTLAVTSAVTFGESTKRTTTSVSDMDQSGNYAAYILDRAVRSAGSGFAQAWNLGVFGCRLNAVRGANVILPRGVAFPAPFQFFLDGSASSATLTVAPLLIGSGQGVDGVSDVIAVMGGNSAAGDVPRTIRSSGASPNILRLDNTISLKAADVVLISRPGTTDCTIEQVSTGFMDVANNETLPLGGTAPSGKPAPYYSNVSALAAGGDAYVTPLGNALATDVQFQLIGVGADRTLQSYDLLQSSGSAETQAMVDGVVRMNAVYGLVNTTNGAFQGWFPATGANSITNMMANPLLARSVAAVRIGLILRSSNYEKTKDNGENVGPGSIQLFGDLPAADQPPVLNITGDALHYRYRVVDFTIPIRNVLLLPTS
ncbi:MAG: PilW family protein [Gammaproteobacteria bacterium]|nr:PilW family protein [Gammaproteobacteria bacterium]MBU2287145.1 PilW family protein [Gammaproteobacteria bacterium]